MGSLLFKRLLTGKPSVWVRALAHSRGFRAPLPVLFSALDTRYPVSLMGNRHRGMKELLQDSGGGGN